MKRKNFVGLALLGALVMTSAARAEGEPQNHPVRTANNTVFLELGGNGLFYTLNYERVFLQDWSQFAVRAGFGYLSLSASSGTGAGTVSASASSMSIPLTASYFGLGNLNHKFEVGGGVLFQHFSASVSAFDDFSNGGWFPILTGIAGYRYSPGHGGFNFRAALTPHYHPDIGFLPYGGVSFGYGF